MKHRACSSSASVDNERWVPTRTHNDDDDVDGPAGTADWGLLGTRVYENVMWCYYARSEILAERA
jgi:hypothetical protein